MRKTELVRTAPKELGRVLLDLLSSPTITSKAWVFRQYDHEVGIRTVAKPGEADAAVLRLPNGKLAAIKVDGNARFCDLDPYVGAASVLAECCRNIVAVGAEPIAFLDHCQFGDPNDEEIFWAFSMAVKGIADFAKAISLPCVGGKVSFYNQDDETGKAIKASPVLTVLGIVETTGDVTKCAFEKDGEGVIIVGTTKPELGGSEYYNLIGLDGSSPPTLDFEIERRVQSAVLECIRKGLVSACHDCSKGGLGVALAEMCVAGGRGTAVDLRPLGNGLKDDELLFSESNSRFILSSNKPDEILRILSERHVPSALVGTVRGTALDVLLPHGRVQIELSAVQSAYLGSLERILEPWQK